MPTTYKGAAEEGNRGQYGENYYRAMAAAGDSKAAESLINFRNAQAANVQAGTEKDITAGIAQRQLDQKYSEAEKAAMAKRTHEEQVKKFDALVKGFEKVFHFYKDGERVRRPQVADFFDNASRYTVEPIHYNDSYETARLSVGQKEDNSGLTHLRQSVVELNNSYRQLAEITRKINESEARYEDASSLEAERDALKKTIPSSEQLLFTVAETVGRMGIDTKDIMSKLAEEKGEYLTEIGEEGAAPAGYEEPFNRGVEKVKVRQAKESEDKVNHAVSSYKPKSLWIFPNNVEKHLNSYNLTTDERVSARDRIQASAGSSASTPSSAPAPTPQSWPARGSGASAPSTAPAQQRTGAELLQVIRQTKPQGGFVSRAAAKEALTKKGFNITEATLDVMEKNGDIKK
jgi:hypothetical protein